MFPKIFKPLLSRYYLDRNIDLVETQVSIATSLEARIVAAAMPITNGYIACVKAVDTFGCDTSITLEVEV